VFGAHLQCGWHRLLRRSVQGSVRYSTLVIMRMSFKRTKEEV
jgi:hypothetical protein